MNTDNTTETTNVNTENTAAPVATVTVVQPATPPTVQQPFASDIGKVRKNGKSKSKSKNKGGKNKTSSPATDKPSNKKSLRGKWGKVGAPPKSVKWPKGKFTMDRLFELNKNQCKLTLRHKVVKMVENKELTALEPQKQPNGAAGRPKSVFILSKNYSMEVNPETAPVNDTIAPAATVNNTEVIDVHAEVTQVD